MPDFDLTGRVAPFGQAADAGMGVPVLDVHYDVSVSGLFGRGDFSQRGIVQLANDDTFVARIRVPDDIPPFWPPQCLAGVTVRAYVPIEHRRDVRLFVGLEGSADEIFAALVAACQNLLVEVDLVGCRTTPVTVALRGDVAPLDGDDEIAIKVLRDRDDPVCVGSITGRRDDGVFRGRVVLRDADLDDEQVWISLDSGPAFPMNRRPYRQIDMDEVFARTRSTTGALAWEDAGGDLLVTHSTTTVGVGTLSENLPDRVAEGALFVNDLDLDFTDGNVRVRGRVAGGGFGFQVVGLGRFDTRFAVAVVDRDLLPFRTLEFDRPLSISAVSSRFDLFPETDLDELPLLNIAPGSIEAFLADEVVPLVRARIESGIAEAVRDRVDEELAALAEPLAAITEDPDGLTDDIRANLFFDVETVAVTADDITVRVFAGVRHFIAGFAGLGDLCPAETTAVMFAARRPNPLRMFRRYKEALSHDDLTEWMERYEEHRRELTRLVVREPALAAEVVRLAADLLPVLGGSGGTSATLGRYGLDRLESIAAAAKAAASDDLRRLVDDVMAVLRQGADLDLADLRALAASERKGGRSKPG